jgi:hypothetical protein
MVICGSNMFEFSVNKDMKERKKKKEKEKRNNDERRIPTCLLACFLALVVKEIEN